MEAKEFYIEYNNEKDNLFLVQVFFNKNGWKHKAEKIEVIKETEKLFVCKKRTWKKSQLGLINSFMLFKHNHFNYYTICYEKHVLKMDREITDLIKKEFSEVCEEIDKLKELI